MASDLTDDELREVYPCEVCSGKGHCLGNQCGLCEGSGVDPSLDVGALAELIRKREEAAWDAGRSVGHEEMVELRVGLTPNPYAKGGDDG